MILVLAEHDRGALNEVTHEAIALARSLGGSVEALLVGEEARPLAQHLAVERVRIAVDSRLDDYAPAAWAACIAQLRPELVVGPGTDRGHEVLAHAAARLEAPLAANCVAAEQGEPLRVTRQRWGGSLLEEALVHGPVKLLTVAPHVFAPAELAATPVVDEFAPELTEADLLVRISRREEPPAGKVQLGDARVVVGGGRGVGSAEGFGSLEELAGLLGGAVGGSRVVTNLGWRPHADQIGQTGARIGPDLYIACGVSGAIQHMVGCKGAKRILAINKDPNAPMVARADYAVIGDLNEIVPAIVAELRGGG
jgi:electron transfer flavoprotein alpha subunit